MHTAKRFSLSLAVATLTLLGFTFGAQAAIDGISGPTFTLTAKDGYISTGDGASIYMWGYANGSASMQLPGPTLLVHVGDLVTIHLTSQITQSTPGGSVPVPVSIVFPGQLGVGATGGTPGLLTNESSGPADVVTYTFQAQQPGTYLYHSGSQTDLQVEMGLFGALIVYPTTANRAYNHPDSAYDNEFLFLLSEMDPTIHEAVEFGEPVDTVDYWAVNWFINGRTAPDTMMDANVPWLPNQPYNSMPMMEPGQRVLLRLIGGGRFSHPFHTHGNHVLEIARDGRLLSSGPGLGADLANLDFTITVSPGQTVDGIFTWTGEGLGWDIYGHTSDSPATLEPNEYAPDHGKPFPVIIPDGLTIKAGATYSGSPWLGALGNLPPGDGAFNQNGGYFHMWHSHNEKEMTNNNIFPGGMMTMLLIDPPGMTMP